MRLFSFLKSIPGQRKAAREMDELAILFFSDDPDVEITQGPITPDHNAPHGKNSRKEFNYGATQ